MGRDHLGPGRGREVETGVESGSPVRARVAERAREAEGALFDGVDHACGVGPARQEFDTAGHLLGAVTFGRLVGGARRQRGPGDGVRLAGKRAHGDLARGSVGGHHQVPAEIDPDVVDAGALRGEEDQVADLDGLGSDLLGLLVLRCGSRFEVQTWVRRLHQAAAVVGLRAGIAGDVGGSECVEPQVDRRHDLLRKHGPRARTAGDRHPGYGVAVGAEERLGALRQVGRVVELVCVGRLDGPSLHAPGGNPSRPSSRWCCARSAQRR